MSCKQIFTSFRDESSLPKNKGFLYFNDRLTTDIYTLSLHDALPISIDEAVLDDEMDQRVDEGQIRTGTDGQVQIGQHRGLRSEEHTSELQSRLHLVCRLLLEKKKKKKKSYSKRMMKIAICSHYQITK